MKRRQHFMFFVCLLLLALHGAEGEPSYDPICDGKEGQYIPDPIECAKFFLCKDHQLVELVCPEGHAFDPKTQVCIKAVSLCIKKDEQGHVVIHPSKGITKFLNKTTIEFEGNPTNNDKVLDDCMSDCSDQCSKKCHSEISMQYSSDSNSAEEISKNIFNKYDIPQCVLNWLNENDNLWKLIKNDLNTNLENLCLGINTQALDKKCMFSPDLRDNDMNYEYRDNTNPITESKIILKQLQKDTVTPPSENQSDNIPSESTTIEYTTPMESSAGDELSPQFINPPYYPKTDDTNTQSNPKITLEYEYIPEYGIFPEYQVEFLKVLPNKQKPIKKQKELQPIITEINIPKYSSTTEDIGSEYDYFPLYDYQPEYEYQTDLIPPISSLAKSLITINPHKTTKPNLSILPTPQVEKRPNIAQNFINKIVLPAYSPTLQTNEPTYEYFNVYDYEPEDEYQTNSILQTSSSPNTRPTNTHTVATEMVPSKWTLTIPDSISDYEYQTDLTQQLSTVKPKAPENDDLQKYELEYQLEKEPILVFETIPPQQNKPKIPLDIITDISVTGGLNNPNTFPQYEFYRDYEYITTFKPNMIPEYELFLENKFQPKYKHKDNLILELLTTPTSGEDRYIPLNLITENYEPQILPAVPHTTLKHQDIPQTNAFFPQQTPINYIDSKNTPMAPNIMTEYEYQYENPLEYEYQPDYQYHSNIISVPPKPFSAGKITLQPEYEYQLDNTNIPISQNKTTLPEFEFLYDNEYLYDYERSPVTAETSQNIPIETADREKASDILQKILTTIKPEKKQKQINYEQVEPMNNIVIAQKPQLVQPEYEYLPEHKSHFPADTVSEKILPDQSVGFDDIKPDYEYQLEFNYKPEHYYQPKFIQETLTTNKPETLTSLPKHRFDYDIINQITSTLKPNEQDNNIVQFLAQEDVPMTLSSIPEYEYLFEYENQPAMVKQIISAQKPQYILPFQQLPENNSPQSKSVPEDDIQNLKIQIPFSEYEFNAENEYVPEYEYYLDSNYPMLTLVNRPITPYSYPKYIYRPEYENLSKLVYKPLNLNETDKEYATLTDQVTEYEIPVAMGIPEYEYGLEYISKLTPSHKPWITPKKPKTVITEINKPVDKLIIPFPNSANVYLPEHGYLPKQKTKPVFINKLDINLPEYDYILETNYQDQIRAHKPLSRQKIPEIVVPGYHNMMLQSIPEYDYPLEYDYSQNYKYKPDYEYQPENLQDILTTYNLDRQPKQMQIVPKAALAEYEYLPDIDYQTEIAVPKPSEKEEENLISELELTQIPETNPKKTNNLITERVPVLPEYDYLTESNYLPYHRYHQNIVQDTYYQPNSQILPKVKNEMTLPQGSTKTIMKPKKVTSERVVSDFKSLLPNTMVVDNDAELEYVYQPYNALVREDKYHPEKVEKLSTTQTPALTQLRHEYRPEAIEKKSNLIKPYYHPKYEYQPDNKDETQYDYIPDMKLKMEYKHKPEETPDDQSLELSPFRNENQPEVINDTSNPIQPVYLSQYENQPDNNVATEYDYSPDYKSNMEYEYKPEIVDDFTIIQTPDDQSSALSQLRNEDRPEVIDAYSNPMKPAYFSEYEHQPENEDAMEYKYVPDYNLNIDYEHKPEIVEYFTTIQTPDYQSPAFSQLGNQNQPEIIEQKTSPLEPVYVSEYEYQPAKEDISEYDYLADSVFKMEYEQQPEIVKYITTKPTQDYQSPVFPKLSYKNLPEVINKNLNSIKPVYILENEYQPGVEEAAEYDYLPDNQFAMEYVYEPAIVKDIRTVQIPDYKLSPHTQFQNEIRPELVDKNSSPFRPLHLPEYEYLLGKQETSEYDFLPHNEYEMVDEHLPEIVEDITTIQTPEYQSLAYSPLRIQNRPPFVKTIPIKPVYLSEYDYQPDDKEMEYEYQPEIVNYITTKQTPDYQSPAFYKNLPEVTNKISNSMKPVDLLEYEYQPDIEHAAEYDYLPDKQFAMDYEHQPAIVKDFTTIQTPDYKSSPLSQLRNENRPEVIDKHSTPVKPIHLQEYEYQLGKEEIPEYDFLPHNEMEYEQLLEIVGDITTIQTPDYQSSPHSPIKIQNRPLFIDEKIIPIKPDYLSEYDYQPDDKEMVYEYQPEIVKHITTKQTPGFKTSPLSQFRNENRPEVIDDNSNPVRPVHLPEYEYQLGKEEITEYDFLPHNEMEYEHLPEIVGDITTIQTPAYQPSPHYPIKIQNRPLLIDEKTIPIKPDYLSEYDYQPDDKKMVYEYQPKIVKPITTKQTPGFKSSPLSQFQNENRPEVIDENSSPIRPVHLPEYEYQLGKEVITEYDFLPHNEMEYEHLPEIVGDITTIQTPDYQPSPHSPIKIQNRPLLIDEKTISIKPDYLSEYDYQPDDKKMVYEYQPEIIKHITTKQTPDFKSSPLSQFQNENRPKFIDENSNPIRPVHLPEYEYQPEYEILMKYEYPTEIVEHITTTQNQPLLIDKKTIPIKPVYLSEYDYQPDDKDMEYKYQPETVKQNRHEVIEKKIIPSRPIQLADNENVFYTTAIAEYDYQSEIIADFPTIQTKHEPDVIELISTPLKPKFLPEYEYKEDYDDTWWYQYQPDVAISIPEYQEDSKYIPEPGYQSYKTNPKSPKENSLQLKPKQPEKKFSLGKLLPEYDYPLDYGSIFDNEYLFNLAPMENENPIDYHIPYDDIETDYLLNDKTNDKYPLSLKGYIPILDKELFTMKTPHLQYDETPKYFYFAYNYPEQELIKLNQTGNISIPMNEILPKILALLGPDGNPQSLNPQTQWPDLTQQKMWNPYLTAIMKMYPQMTNLPQVIEENPDFFRLVCLYLGLNDRFPIKKYDQLQPIATNQVTVPLSEEYSKLYNYLMPSYTALNPSDFLTIYLKNQNRDPNNEINPEPIAFSMSDYLVSGKQPIILLNNSLSMPGPSPNSSIIQLDIEEIIPVNETNNNSPNGHLAFICEIIPKQKFRKHTVRLKIYIKDELLDAEELVKENYQQSQKEETYINADVNAPMYETPQWDYPNSGNTSPAYDIKNFDQLALVGALERLLRYDKFKGDLNDADINEIIRLLLLNPTEDYYSHPVRGLYQKNKLFQPHDFENIKMILKLCPRRGGLKLCLKALEEPMCNDNMLYCITKTVNSLYGQQLAQRNRRNVVKLR